MLASSSSSGHPTLDLRGYFHGSKLHTTRHRKPQSMVNNEYLSNVFSGPKEDANNSYSGVLHFPQWNLSMKSQGRNCIPSSDHHYLAKDTASPPAIHENLS